ncbi:cytochrome P450 [Aspergillus undulatus]|uniref:cytochrome P450 n=1 Tax=Aspergillus undulatus TaxID=1810928 RepID=UPI003CCD846E
MYPLFLFVSSLACTAAALLWRYFRVPSTIPRNIPRIPIWVNFYAWYHDLSVIELYNAFYREPMEAHGTIAVWFTGVWCVLTSKPEYLVEIFRNDNTYPKVGVNIRGKGSLMGMFAGENIINSSKPSWNTLTSVMKPGFLKSFDTAAIHDKARKVPERFLRAQRGVGSGSGVLVAHWAEKYAQDVMGLCLFDFDLQALDEPRVPYEPLIGQILPAIFSRWAIRRSTTAEFDRLLDGIVDSAKTADTEKHPKVVSQMLKKALDDGRLTPELFRANLRMSFMFGHDTTAIFIGLTMYVLGSNTALQDHLRVEALQSTGENVHDLPYLTSLLYEVLRLYPPVTEMLNHTTTHAATLGGKVTVHPGTSLGWNSYGVHTNPAIWGPDAMEARPERWGRTVKEIQANFRLQSTKGNYIPFSLHARKCLGQSLVLTEVKLVVFEMVRRVKWVVDPTYRLNLGGVMFTMPLGLRIIVEELDQDAGAAVETKQAHT